MIRRVRNRGFSGPLAGGLALVVLSVGAPAALAGPSAGARYDGKSATGQRIFLSVNADATRLARYTFAVSTDCTDGKRRVQGLIDGGQPPTPIDAAGAFAHESQVQRGFYPTASGRVIGRFTTSVPGTFDATGDSVTGTIESTFKSERFNCSSGPVSFTMYRDGTAQAPFSDTVMTTGLYTAAGKGVTARVRALAPGRAVLRSKLKYRARCRSGGSLRSRLIFSSVLSDNGRRTIVGRGRLRIRKDNVTVRVRYRLQLRFFQNAGYKLRGSWNVRARVSRGGRQIDTCRVKSSFKGAVKSGTAGG